MAKVLLDTNVIIDYLARRQPFYDSARKVITLCYRDDVDGFISG